MLSLYKCLSAYAGFYIGKINMLWVAALAIGIVIIVGFMMVAKRKSKKPIPVSYKATHAIATAVGALIAVIAAFMGDNRLWTNIVLAIIIVILGVIMALGKVTKTSAKPVLYSHALIGITCYVIFVYYIFIA